MVISIKKIKKEQYKVHKEYCYRKNIHIISFIVTFTFWIPFFVVLAPDINFARNMVPSKSFVNATKNLSNLSNSLIISCKDFVNNEITVYKELQNLVGNCFNISDSYSGTCLDGTFSVLNVEQYVLTDGETIRYFNLHELSLNSPVKDISFYCKKQYFIKNGIVQEKSTIFLGILDRFVLLAAFGGIGFLGVILSIFTFLFKIYHFCRFILPYLSKRLNK